MKSVALRCLKQSVLTDCEGKGEKTSRLSKPIRSELKQHEVEIWTPLARIKSVPFLSSTYPLVAMVYKSQNQPTTLKFHLLSHLVTA